MTMTEILIPTPDNLTKGEADLWSWALEGMVSALGDDDFMRDNPDMTTVVGQTEDMQYRIGTQAVDMASGLDTYQAEAAAIRVAESTLVKLATTPPSGS